VGGCGSVGGVAVCVGGRAVCVVVWGLGGVVIYFWVAAGEVLWIDRCESVGGWVWRWGCLG